MKKESQEKSTEIEKYEGTGQEMDWNDSNGSERQIKGNERAWK